MAARALFLVTALVLGLGVPCSRLLLLARLPPPAGAGEARFSGLAGRLPPRVGYYRAPDVTELDRYAYLNHARYALAPVRLDPVLGQPDTVPVPAGAPPARGEGIPPGLRAILAEGPIAGDVAAALARAGFSAAEGGGAVRLFVREGAP